MSRSSSESQEFLTLAALVRLIEQEELTHSSSIVSERVELIAYFAATWYVAIYGTPLFPQPIYADGTGPVISGFQISSSALTQGNSDTSLLPQAERLVKTLCSAYRDIATEDIRGLALIKNGAWSIARLGADSDTRIIIYPEVMKNHVWAMAKEEILSLPE